MAFLKNVTRCDKIDAIFIDFARFDVRDVCRTIAEARPDDAFTEPHRFAVRKYIAEFSGEIGIYCRT